MFNVLAKHPIISVLVLLGLNILGICLLISVVPRDKEVEDESTSRFRQHRHTNNLRFSQQKSDFANGIRKVESNDDRLSFLEEMGDESLNDGNAKDAIAYYNKAFDLRKSLKL
ncbi:MAG: hypothetical protein K2X81_16250, partial [Candidatus Obscuribacterales bacterium]|nr:hypothetical protein [Candidatus Obscuribacterales bacterium]